MDFDSKRAFELIEELSYERVSGTAEELRTAEAIMEKVSALGVDCHLEEFEVEDGKVSEAKLTVLEPYQKEYEVTGYIRSDSTPDEGLILDLAYVENGHPTLLRNVKGKAVLTNGRIYRKNYEKIQKAEPAAIIGFVGNIDDKDEETDFDIGKLRETMTDDFGTNVVVNLRAKDAMEIVARGASKIKLVVKSERFKSISHNVCAEIKGTEFPDEIVSYGAHYDSVKFSKGAYDNMTGSAVILEVLRYFAANPPKRTLKFNWFGSEEQGLLGSKAYVKMHAEELEKHGLMINVDMAGPILGFEFATVTGNDSIKPYIDGIMDENGLAVETDNNIYSSDSIPFADSGIPAVNFGRWFERGAGFIHSRRDDLALGFLSADALGKTIEAVMAFSKRVVNANVFPIKREISDKIKKDVDEYLFKKKNDSSKKD